MHPNLYEYSMNFMRTFYILSFSALLLTFSCGGCDSENNVGQATVLIDSIMPSGGYPGVEMEVAFTITPGDGTNAEKMNWQIRFGDGSNATGRGATGTSKHAYEKPGQYDIDVQAWFDSAKVGNAVQAIRVYSPVDLEIKEVVGSPANLRVGEKLQAAFIVENLTAAEVFTDYSIDIYLSKTPINNVDGLDGLTPVGTTTITPDTPDEAILKSGESRNSAHTITISNDLSSGDYYIIAHLDSSQHISDTNRSNNIASSTSFVRIENSTDAQPDPLVKNLFAIPDRAFPQLNSVTRGFVLENKGSEDAFDIIYKTYLSIGDAILDDQDMLIDTSNSVSVFANSTKDILPKNIILPVGKEIIPPAGQEIKVWVIVKIESDNDADLTNNTAALVNPITVTDQAVIGPDIVAKNFTVSPNSTFLNGPLQINADISNEGTVRVGSFFCGIYLGSQPRVNTESDPRLANINIPKLEATDTLHIDQSIVVPGLYDPGTYFLYIVCDPLNALQESFRSNNASIYLEPITITDKANVDIFIDTFTIPTDVNEGETINIQAKICVGGSNPSGITHAALFQSSGNQVDFNSEPLTTIEVPNINPNACEDISFSIPADCANFISTYSFGVKVDSNSVLPEYNETNNTKSSNNTMTINGPFCTCNEEATEPNDSILGAAALPTGSSMGGICTAGNCDYYEIPLTTGDSVILTNQFNHEKGELVTKLFGPAGQTEIKKDSSPDKQEVGVFLIPQDASYYLQVCGATASDRNIYNLDTEIFSKSAGRDLFPYDFVLPAGDSFSIGARLNTSFRIYNLGLSATDATEARFVISSNQAIGDADDIVLSTTPIPAIPSGGFIDLTKKLTLPATLTDGNYYIGLEADAFNTVTESNENNNVLFSKSFTVKTICFDSLEPNDTFGDAVDIQSQSYSNLVSCKAAPDYYRICPGDAKKFELSVNFNNAAGDIDLELFNDQFQRIKTSANGGVDVEHVEVDYVIGTSCYYSHVYVTTLDPDLETNYDLVLNVQDVDPSLKCDFLFEPNDSFASASSFLSALNQPNILDRCPTADSDYYALNLSAGRTISLSANKDPVNQPGILRIQVYKPNQSAGPNKESAPGVPNATISNYLVPDSGTYFVQITAGGSARNVTYKLTATGLDGVDLNPINLTIGPGVYSPNDQLRWAFDLRNLLSDNVNSPTYNAYFGSTPQFNSATDLLLGQYNSANVNGNTSIPVFGQSNIPIGTMAGTHYLHIVVDPTNALNDANTQNNIASVQVLTN